MQCKNMNQKMISLALRKKKTFDDQDKNKNNHLEIP